MLKIRTAIPADAPVIAAQRVRMFRDNQLRAVGPWSTLRRRSEQWIAARLRDGAYVGWIVEDCAQHGRPSAIVGGAGLWVMEWPPHFLHFEPVRGYLLNFYVAPQARRQGLATRLVRLALAECRRREIRLATLHASTMGRPVYEAMGWNLSNEMTFRLGVRRTGAEPSGLPTKTKAHR